MLRFDLHETLRFYQQQQNLHPIDTSIQFDKNEKEEVQDEKIWFYNRGCLLGTVSTTRRENFK